MLAQHNGSANQVMASSFGRFVNTGNGPTFQVIDIGHKHFFALIEPNTAFWSLIKREKLADVLAGTEDASVLGAYKAKASDFAQEMKALRFQLKPSAVYFNPTEQCNLNCSYCYIPSSMRKNGQHMSQERLLTALQLLKEYFQRTIPKSTVPQIVFHGAEPLLNRDAVFAGIEAFHNDFRFGVQTNATLLDSSAIEFLTQKKVSIGLSLDAPTKKISDLTRKDWAGNGVHKKVLDTLSRLKGYDAWSVICTITRENLGELTNLVHLLHQQEVPTCLLNIVRCTLPPSRKVKPNDSEAANSFLAALESTYQLYQETGRKLIVGNFANILLAMLAPSARRLMCDISPCGGGRCFFAVTPNGDLFPCSEFIGLNTFCGGNLFHDGIEKALESVPFKKITNRTIEEIEPCRNCAIRHFCGSPCPAEAQQMNGGMNKTGAFCEFYEEQARYAFRIIADGREEAFLWDDWDKELKNEIEIRI